MSAIAARLGGSKGTLYNYFTSKTELFAAYMAARAWPIPRPCWRPRTTRRRSTRRCAGSACGFLEFMLRDESMAVHRLVVAEAHRFPELGEAFYEAGPKLATADARPAG